MAKKGEIDNNVLSKESAAFIYKTEKCQRKFVGFPSQKDRYNMYEKRLRSLPLQIARVPPCISPWSSDLSPH